MSDKRFSQDFTQKTGNTPLNYRVLVEDPATGTEYWVTMEQAQAILKSELTDEAIARGQADALKLDFISTNEQTVLDSLVNLRCTTVLCNPTDASFTGSTADTFSGFFTVYNVLEGEYLVQKSFSALKKAWYYRKLDTTWSDWKLDTSIQPNYWVKKGLILPSFDNADDDISLVGIVDIKVLYDRDEYLSNHPVYLWAYGNKKTGLNRPERYIYFTKENYIDADSVLCYSSILGGVGDDSATLTENFIVEEQNDSGLSFIVTVNWGEILETAIDNDDLVKINPFVSVGVVDKVKDSYFIKESSDLKKLPDGFILDISMSKFPAENLAIWYVSNLESARSLYIGIKAANNIIPTEDESIYATYTAVGSSDGIEDITLTPATAGNTVFYIKVDWSKIPVGYDSISSGNLSCTLNTKNIPCSGDFDIFKNMPIIGSQIFLRSDKSIPIFKNSMFTKLTNINKVDLGLICSDNGNGKMIDIKEPTNLGGTLGQQVDAGSARFILSKTSDYSKFIYKDVEVFLKDVSELTNQTVKIMSLGDSLTEGWLWANTPVCMLADELSALGVDVEFIGSLARSLTNKQSETVKINFEGRGGWRYRTLTGLESKFAGLNVVIPASATKSEWVEGVDGTFDTIKANNTFLYPATALDKANYPDFCFHFVSGNTGYNQSYTDNPSLVDYVIFDPARYFSQRNIDVPDILTMAFGTNEWYLPGFDLEEASKQFKFIVQQFRRASANLKIVVIPANAVNLRRQLEWETKASILTSEIIKAAAELDDNKLYVCPIYMNSSRTLAWDNLTSTPADISENNDVKSATISQDVHSLYVDDESNNQYADSLTACIVNII